MNKDRIRLLILCTGNSCRSQMAEAFFKHYFPRWEVYSAGTEPAEAVHPLMLEVMSERGFDLNGRYPKPVEKYLDQPFDIVLTVCDEAHESCPVFQGDVKIRLHRGFDDPALAEGDTDKKLKIFRRVRDEIEQFVRSFVIPHG
jgi:arsenate reductase